MKTDNILKLISFSLAILITCSQASANSNQTKPISSILKRDRYLNKIDQWINERLQSQEATLKLTTPVVLAGAFCFIAASISSAGGIGGGGLFIPILTIVAGLDLKTASSFSAVMVTGGALANVICNLFARNTKVGGKTLIDYDIALLSEPCMLLGVSVGVICNLVFPEGLITVLFAVFLAWSTFKTCKNGVSLWRLESEEALRNGFGNLENRLAFTNGREDVISGKEPLLGMKVDNKLRFPWVKLGVLVMVWFSFFSLYLLRGNHYGKGIIPMEPCGMVYWILSSLQIPLAIIFTVWIILRKENIQYIANQEELEGLSSDGTPNKSIFPIMALLAGMLGGVFGIGGGMLISPLLLHIGVDPEVTAATCSFMVFFSSTMSSFQYLFLGMEHADTAVMLAIICFVGSMVGLLVVQRVIQNYGRASLIVFSVSIVMCLSAILLTSFGALDVWRDYTSGKNMGFKFPC